MTRRSVADSSPEAGSGPSSSRLASFKTLRDSRPIRRTVCVGWDFAARRQFGDGFGRRQFCDSTLIGSFLQVHVFMAADFLGRLRPMTIGRFNTRSTMPYSHFSSPSSKSSEECCISTDLPSLLFQTLPSENATWLGLISERSI